MRISDQMVTEPFVANHVLVFGFDRAAHCALCSVDCPLPTVSGNKLAMPTERVGEIPSRIFDFYVERGRENGFHN